MTKRMRGWAKGLVTGALVLLIGLGTVSTEMALAPAQAQARERATVTQVVKKAAHKKKAYGKNKAIARALKNAKLKKSQVKKLKATVDREDGRKIYEVEFRTRTREYEYDIDYYSGKIVDKDVERIGR